MIEDNAFINFKVWAALVPAAGLEPAQLFRANWRPCGSPVPLKAEVLRGAAYWVWVCRPGESRTSVRNCHTGISGGGPPLRAGTQ